MAGILSINTNISAMTAQRTLGTNTQLLQKTSERLSSGLRISHPSDDAAGLAIASSLQVDSRVYQQGIRNVNDGVSLIDIAEGSLEQLNTIVIRLRELAEQSSTGTLATAQRRSLDAEAQSLRTEYNRITSTTGFNGLSLLDGSTRTLEVQSGYGSDGQMSLPLASGLLNFINDGTFTAAVSSVTSASTQSDAATGDFNGDGVSDIVTMETTKVNIALGNGDGTFRAATSYSGTSAQGSRLTISDLNNDGKLDLIVGRAAGVGAGDIDILIGNGDGTFKSPLLNAGGTGINDLYAQDINGDGKTDIVASCYGVGARVLLGNGNGTFAAGVNYGSAVPTYNAALLDLNNDGKTDIILGDYLGTNLDTMLGNGDGTFRWSTSYSSANQGQGVTSGDFNHDGNADVALMTTTGVAWKYSWAMAMGA